MQARSKRIWLTLAAGGALVLGCQTARERPVYSGDPLLITKKPIEGKVELSEPAMVAEADPEPPPHPSYALAYRPVNPPGEPGVNPERTPDPLRSGLPVSTVATIKGPVPALHAGRSRVAPDTQDPPAARLQGTGFYGNAPDYRWLQGVLDRHYLGHMNLRYCDHSVEDAWGGKVILENDPRLAQFRDGDVIHVEGEIITDAGQAAHGAWDHYPHYRIRTIQLIQHGQE